MNTFLAGLKKLNYKQVITFIVAVAAAIFLFTLVEKIESNPEDSPTTYLICIFGAILGWFVAILVSPYGKNDGDKLDKFSKIVGAFLSGYILSKLDNLFEVIMDPKNMLETLYGQRILLFVCFFIVMWIVVFSFRVYAIADVTQSQVAEK